MKTQDSCFLQYCRGIKIPLTVYTSGEARGVGGQVWARALGRRLWRRTNTLLQSFKTRF